jgi:hypothetical protein
MELMELSMSVPSVLKPTLRAIFLAKSDFIVYLYI